MWRNIILACRITRVRTNEYASECVQSIHLRPSVLIWQRKDRQSNQVSLMSRCSESSPMGLHTTRLKGLGVASSRNYAPLTYRCSPQAICGIWRSACIKPLRDDGYVVYANSPVS